MSACTPIATSAATSGSRTRPMLNPMASSSRLMLTPSAIVASPRVAAIRPAAPASSSRPLSRIQPPMPMTAAAAR